MIVRVHYEIRETALTIICDDSYLPDVKDAVHDARFVIESKIAEDPFFGTTYGPYPVVATDHILIRRMCQASTLSGVGPMAGVAGAIAAHAVETVVEKGCENVLIDNGGDICMRMSQAINIGIFSGDGALGDMAFRMEPNGDMMSVCSSSGRVGPSVSFGRSGICTVFSKDAILADCCATAFGNMIVGGGRDEMSTSAEHICSIEGIDGCVCICDGLVSLCGRVPPMTDAKECGSRITSCDILARAKDLL